MLLDLREVEREAVDGGKTGVGLGARGGRICISSVLRCSLNLLSCGIRNTEKRIDIIVATDILAFLTSRGLTEARENENRRKARFA